MRSRAPQFSGKAGNKKAVLPKQNCRKGSSGLRLPASASCLGRHSRLAGRGPNSSSLFPPQAAVVAVARKGLLAPFRPRRGSRNGKKLAASLRRVAAPSVCFAAARILLAAAPTAPPCFRHWRRSSLLPPKGEPYPLYLLCARPSLPSMMSFAAAAMSGQRSARALASSGGNLPSTQSAKS